MRTMKVSARGATRFGARYTFQVKERVPKTFQLKWGKDNILYDYDWENDKWHPAKKRG